MDYEKKYKEAIERAKIWQEHLYDVNDKDYADELNYIFPELAESEDEKIRREIINYFKCQTRDEPSRKDIHNKWISWLERQEGCEGFQETGKCFADGECKAKREAEQELTDLNEFINELSKQFPEVSFAKLSRIVVRVAKWAKSNDEEKSKVQPKQEWNEEDECYMTECINAIATKDSWSFEEKRKTKHWVKSLKQRIDNKKKGGEE